MRGRRYMLTLTIGMTCMTTGLFLRIPYSYFPNSLGLYIVMYMVCYPSIRASPMRVLTTMRAFAPSLSSCRFVGFRFRFRAPPPLTLSHPPLSFLALRLFGQPGMQECLLSQ